MSAETTSTPSQDDRILAALSHASAAVLTVGIIAPIIIWVTHKERSRFVAFQALQAAVYQGALLAFWLLSMGCYLVTAIISIPLEVASSRTGAGPFEGPMFFPVLVISLAIFLSSLWMIYAMYGAYSVFSGRPFQYPLIGRWLAKRYAPSGG